MNLDTFSPDPVLVAFLLAKQFWMPLILVLAGLRVMAARGAARAFAALSAGIAAAGLVFLTLPALGWYAAPFIGAGAAWSSGWGGIGAPLVASLPLLLSALLPGRRWWVLDAVHVAALAGLVALALYAAFA